MKSQQKECQTATSDSKVPKRKHASSLQYYTFLIGYIIVICSYMLCHKIQVSLALAILYVHIGKFLPNDRFQVDKEQDHNQSILHVLPLFAKVVAGWLTIAYFWNIYDEFAINMKSIVSALVCMSYLITPSINASHELIHRDSKFSKLVGFINLIPFQFTTYPAAHLYLHHKNVGSKVDPITSEKDYNFYEYYVRALYSTYHFTYNYSQKFFYICMVSNWSYLLLLYMLACLDLGNYYYAFCKVFFFYSFANLAIILTETVEYIEHYGLIYRTHPDKIPVKEICSWNSETNIIFNWINFRFQRHSDHHMNAYKIYSSLELTERMPKYPFSFPEALQIALIPPLWYYITNPYLEEVMEGRVVDKNHKIVTRVVVESLNIAIATLLIWNAR